MNRSCTLLATAWLGFAAAAPDALAGNLPPLIKIGQAGKLGFASPCGSFVVPPRYVGCGRHWSDGFLWVVDSPSVGCQTGNFMDRNGSELLDRPAQPWADDMVRILPSFRDGRAQINLLDGTRAVVDTNGTLAIGLDQPSAKIFPFERRGLWGFQDWEGREHIPPRFSAVRPFIGPSAPAMANGLWGLIDARGQWRLPPACDSIVPGENQCWVASRRKAIGILRPDGSWIREPAFHETGTWGPSAVAVLDEKWTLIHLQTGDLLFPPLLDEIGPVYSKTAWVRMNHRWGLAGLDATLRLPFLFDSVLPTAIDPKLVIVRKGLSEGLVNADGQWHLPCADHSILPVAPALFLVRSNGGAGLFDVSQSVWRIAPAFDDVLFFDELPRPGAVVRKGQRYGWTPLDAQSPVLPADHDQVEPWFQLLHARRGNHSALFDVDGQPILSWEAGATGLPDPDVDFFNGFGKVICHGKAGLIDTNGRVRLECRFQDVGALSEGLIPAMENQQWGFVDLDGIWIIPPRFENARPFTSGLAAVSREGKTGFIDRRGIVRIPFDYEDAGWVFQGRVPVAQRVQDKLLWGLADEQGQVVMPLEFDAIEWIGLDPESTRIHGRASWEER